MAGKRGCCGLFIVKTDKPIPLTNVEYEVDIKGFAGSITIHQTYKNVESTDLECVYGFPINDQAAVTDFTIKIGDRTLTSQLKKKEEAFKEYNDALERGDGAYLLDQADRSDDTFVLSVGRLPPGQECRVSISYVALLDSLNEVKQRLVIPTALAPRYNPEPEKSQGSVAPPEKYQPSVPYTATLKAHIQAIGAVKSVSSPSHPLSVSIDSANKVSVSFGAAHQPLDKDIVVDIEVKDKVEHAVFVEQLPSGQFVAMYSFIPDFQSKSSDVKSELIFVVDCSGSMNGDRIEDARRAMQIFLRSIPEGCYFNFYRFGSTFESLFPQSEMYGEESFKKAKEYTDKFQADMGGTEILPALQNIFAKEVKAGFTRQLFVLTDGEVTNTEQVIGLVRSNAHNSRVFSFGIGDSPSRSLVNGIAAAGNGKAEYAKKGEVLEDKVGRHLSRALQPAVTNAAVLWEDFANVQQVPSMLPPAFKGDRQIAYAIFEGRDAKSGTVVLHLEGKPLSIPVDISKADKTAKSPLAKLAARAMIKELEIMESSPPEPKQSGGSLQNRNTAESKGGDSKDLKERIIEISLTHGIVSKYASLIALEKRDNAEAGKMELREVPVQSNEGQQMRGFGGSAPRIMACAMPMSFSAKAMSFGGGGMRGPVMMKKSSGGATRHRKAMVAAVDAQDSFMDVDNDEEDLASDGSQEVPVLNKILNLQAWNGHWAFTEELEKLLGVKKETARQTLQKEVDDSILATLVVMAFLEAKCQTERNIWEAIQTKAIKFVNKTMSNTDAEQSIETLKTLF